MHSAAALVLMALVAAPPAPPTRAALRRAFEKGKVAVVEVVGPKQRGTGVLVGEGHVATSVRFVSLESTTVRFEGAEHTANLQAADARSGLAVVRVADATWPAAAVRAHAPLKKGDWLLGISIDKKKRPVPHRARIVEAPTPGSFFKLDAPLPAGTALFDMNGQLVGLVVKPPRAAPVDAIRAVLQSAPEPAP